MMRRMFVAGNWKMYKTVSEALAFAEAFKGLVASGGDTAGCEVAVCAPFTQLFALKEAFLGSGVGVGAQNVWFEEEGAFTGEVAPRMLDEIGVKYCIVGHSERRQYFSETDGIVNKKLHALFRHGIVPIFCVGEVLAQRDAGEEFSVVGRQVAGGLDGVSAQDAAKLVIAYEPVWAIGTGRTATAAQAEEMCAFIRGEVRKLYGEGVAEAVRIQYGGSVKPENAAEILGMENIDGALVGGASLAAEPFWAICGAG